MLSSKALLILFASAALGADFSGTAAFNYAKAAAELGPRPPGSPANHRLQSYIEAQLRKTGCQIIEDSFRSQTPVGTVVMKNIIARLPGSSGRIIAITGHYDTKYMPKQRFVGANDGGSSTGFLLELARVLGTEKRTDEIDLVWFDGEEAYGEWSATDSVYGSRHLAEKWANDGTLSRVKALINVDMIGDKDLGILYESNSSPDLLKLVWKTADDLGYGKYFLTQPSATEDDHTPFLARGVNALDLIDFDYGPMNSYWHTNQDTVDKLSPHSFEVVGAVLTQVIHKLE